jgi:hypothetical protein
VFCRLEHLVPWEMQGPVWEAAAEPAAPGREAEEAAVCALCEAELTDTRVLLVRHRGEHRIADGFCSVDHMAAWARAGGRFA